jgi:hypothetical protein
LVNESKHFLGEKAIVFDGGIAGNNRASIETEYKFSMI